MKMRPFYAFLLLLTSLLIWNACDFNQQAPADGPLDGTSWELYAFRKSSPIEGTEFTARFEAGQVSGSGGCNQYGGSYAVEGNRLTISELYSTEMACLEPEGLMEQEAYLLEFLGSAVTFSIDAGRLIILRPDGEVLTFDANQ